MATAANGGSALLRYHFQNGGWWMMEDGDSFYLSLSASSVYLLKWANDIDDPNR
jgi:hypothetical protein